ncbi:hypothetical protein BsWGS_05795 [Bradybaena similaris]
MANSDEASDISETDVNKLASSLGALDDMDADLFGERLNKKNTATSSALRQTSPRRNVPHLIMAKSPTRVQSPTQSDPTSPPGSARTSLKRKPVKPPSPSTVSSNPLAFSPRMAQPEHKPGTAPGKMTDIGSASKNLLPGQKIQQRPETAPKLKKKFDFGEFDPDDPLAGVLSGSDDISESDHPKSATKNSAPASKSQPRAAVNDVIGKKDSPPVSQSGSPRRHNLLDRPPTRSGSSPPDNNVPAMTDTPAEADNSSGQTVKTQGGIFSDSDDLLDGLGLDEKPALATRNNVAAQKTTIAESEEIRPARSVFDSLLGKGSSTAAQLLERKEKKEFVLDTKYSTSAAGGSGRQDEEDDFQFGSYQPSAASGSHPNSRRSVRFQDDDDIFGLESRPSPRSKPSGVKKTPPDMDWLELVAKPDEPAAVKTTTASQQGMPNTATAEVVASAHKLPEKSSQKVPESHRKAVGNENDSTVSTASNKSSSIAKAGSNARAWLGLEDSESDGELFKPKKSTARSATLPQSPAVSSASASPKILPKKPTKKAPSSKESPPASHHSKDDDEDDWLARAKSRRQQMLAKEEGKGTADTSLKNSILESQREASEQTMPVSSAVLKTQTFESSRIAQDISSHDKIPDVKTQTADLHTAREGPMLGARLPFSADTVTQDQLPRVPPLAGQEIASLVPQHTELQPSSQHQQLQLLQQLFPQEQPPQQQRQYTQQPSQVQQLPPSKQQQYMLQQLQYIPQPQYQPQKQSYQPEQQQSQLIQTYHQIHHEHLFQPQTHRSVQEQDKLQHTQQNHMLLSREQQPPSDVIMPSYSQIMSTVRLPDSLPEAQAVIRKFELEKAYSESLLESTRRRYEEEMLAVEISYKNRLQILEDSNKRREARLREDNEGLMQQHLSKIRQLEQEKSDLIASQYHRMEDLERQKADDLEKMREQQRLTIAALKRDHEEALERLANAKNQEINMVANANDTSKSLTAVVQQIQNNARDLEELQVKIQSWNKQGLDEREISLRSKDEQLRILQERLNKQAEDNDRERRRLEDLIAQMESQLKDQSRTLEEERWKLKQDQSRLEAQHRSLEDERRQWLEQQTRERINMERARDNHLEEQSRYLAQIGEERRMLTEERTKFQVEQKIRRDKDHQDATKRSQAEADYEVLMRTIAEEKSYQNTRKQELHKEEERIALEKSRLDRERNLLEQDKEKLASQAHQIREQSEQIDHLTQAARRSQQDGEQAQEEAAQYRAHLEKKEVELQKQINGFKLMEDHISQEKLRLAKEKKEIENLKNSALCANCRSPLHGNNVPLQNGYNSPQLSSTVLQSVPAVPVHSSIQQYTSPLDRIAISIANDRAVRMLKIQAIKDKEFLQEENMYLEGLRHTPYYSTGSKS